MQIKSINYIDADDIRELTGKHWGDFEFAQMAANDSYVRMDCSDAGLEELYESLEWEVGKGNEPRPEDYDDPAEYEWKSKHCYATRLRNQIALVEILRKRYGFMFEILVWISW